MSRMIHPLAKARGHGSAKSGVRHWLAQRSSAVLLLVLTPWVVYSLPALAGAPHAEALAWAARPLNAALLILTLLSLLYHAVLGLQVVIEDYVHHAALEITLLFSVRSAACLAAVVGVIFALKPAFGT